MTVYADILILVNFIVDYFLIMLSCRFLQKKPRLWRLLLSSATGGAFSLYIFLPQTHFLVNFGAQLLMCTVMCFIAFGFESLKSFFRSVATLTCVNFAYSGAMIALWLIFKPYGMVINNSVVYFNISPVFLTVFSVIGYFATVLIRKLLKRPFLQSTECTVVVYSKNKNIRLNGIVDTGNSLIDVFGISEIFITEEKTVNELLGPQKQNPTIYRKIPCSTVAGEKLLDGYRIDRAQIFFNNKKYDFKNPVLAVSGTPIDEAQIIVNPENLN